MTLQTRRGYVEVGFGHYMHPEMNDWDFLTPRNEIRKKIREKPSTFIFLGFKLSVQNMYCNYTLRISDWTLQWKGWFEPEKNAGVGIGTQHDTSFEGSAYTGYYS